jgi:hypothetical protein
MKKFFLKLALIVVPIFLLLAFPIFVMVIGGELTPPDDVIARQQVDRDILYAPAYSDFELYYRMQSTLAHQPDVLVLGNSRTLFIRSQFFNPGTKFYNAGLLSKGIQNYRVILDHIPVATQPKIMIIDLEQYQFNYSNLDFSSYYNLQPAFVKPQPMQYILNLVVRSWPLVYRDYFEKKFSIRELLAARKTNNRIGLIAITANEGFRQDGSYRNGTYVDHPHSPRNYDYGFKSSFALIQSQQGYFRANPAGVSQDAVDETDALLKEAKARGIYIIAYMPPYAPTIYSALKADPTYNYIFQIQSKVQPIFDKYNFPLFNFSDPSTIGAKDSEFLDGYHPGEKVYLRFFIKMAEENPVLAKLTDVNRLKQALNSTTNDYEVFGQY